MSGVEALALVIGVAVLVLLVALIVLLARADRMLSEARGLLADLAARPPMTATEPTSAEVSAPAPEPVVVTSLAMPGTALAVPESTSGPTLREIATATLGPPLIRAAALGYGVRDVLAERSDPTHRSRPRGRRPRSRSTR